MITTSYTVIPIDVEEKTFYFAFKVIHEDGKVVNLRPWTTAFFREEEAQKFVEAMNEVSDLREQK